MYLPREVESSRTSKLPLFRRRLPAPGPSPFGGKIPPSTVSTLEFDIDGNYESDIGGGDTNWVQFGPSPVPSGQHLLTWTVYSSGDNDPAQAAYLDEVSFIPDSSVPPPTITLQPLDQTNYPGYTAALLADSTNSPAPSWQSYQVGTGIIPGANNKLYTPTNSGTAGVAGSYFAIATNVGGSTTSRTAVVTFATATPPPDWSPAFRAQIYGYDNQTPTTNYGIACLLNSSGNVIYTANSFSGTNYFASDTLISGSNRFAAGLFKHYTNGSSPSGAAPSPILATEFVPSMSRARAGRKYLYVRSLFRNQWD